MAKKKVNKKKPNRKKTKIEVSPPPLVGRVPWIDVIGVMIVALGLFTALALASYRPTDLSGVAAREGVANMGGVLGAWLAEGFAELMGRAAWVLPAGMLYAGVQLLRHGVTAPRIRPVIGVSLMVCSAASLLHLQLAEGAAAPESMAGGALGAALGGAALRYVGSVGAYIVLIVGLLLAFQIAMGLRVGPVVDRITLYVHRLVPELFRWAGNMALEGSSAAGEAMRSHLDAWREARDAEPELGHANPLLEDDEGEEGWDIPGARKAKIKRGPKVKKGDEAPGEAAAVEVSSADVPIDDESPSVVEGTPDAASSQGDSAAPSGSEPTLEEKAAILRARRLAKKGGPKIIKNRDAARIASDGASATGSLESDGEQTFRLPPLSLLQVPPPVDPDSTDEAELHESARVLEQKLRDYGVDGEVVEIHPGPIITMYEYVPAPGIKVSKITNLSNDLAMALRATRIRIVAPIPGKAAVGIEVPNKARETVYLRENFAHKSFANKGLKLPIALGKDIEGIPFAADMAKMPHLLVAGATGTGKSVAVNSMILSLLFSRTPDEVRLILVDPKMLEFSLYNDIPHLLLPVVTNPKKAAQALNWAVEEMTRRYKLLARVGTRNIANYNKKVEQELERWEQHGGMPPEYIPWEDPAEGDEDAEPKPPSKLPYIVIIIDELADLMMVAAKEVQDAIVRLAQMARAAGIHLLLATQRPSVDVITGLIKANFPSRISFQVSSKTDSRTILDTNGAEHLLGMGDMLYLPPGVAQLNRLHAPFCSDEEVRVVTDFLKAQGEPQYEESLIASTSVEEGGGLQPGDEDYDELYDKAVAIVTEQRSVSISGIQRRLKIGYNRSARIVEVMEREGVISCADHTGKREVLAPPIDF